MLFRKFSYSVIARGIATIINFLVFIITSRYLGIETRGEISLIVLNIANIQMIGEIFSGYALVHFIPKFSLRKILLYGTLWITALLIAGSYTLYLLGYLIPHYEWHFVIAAGMVSLNTFCMVIILGKNNIRLYNWLSVLQPLLLLTILSFDIFIEKKMVLDTYFDALYYSFGAALLINIYTITQYLKKDINEKFEFLSVISNGFLSQWGNWMHLLSNRFSYYILSTITIQKLGLYSTAVSLIESVFIIYTGISTVVLSFVSNESDREKAKKITIKAATGSFILTALSLLILLSIPEEWLLFVFGKSFAGIKEPMIILSFGIALISYSAVFSHYFSGIGILKYNAVSNTLACLFTVMFSNVFIQQWGIKGAAITGSVSYIIEALLVSYFFMKTEKLQWKEMWKVHNFIWKI